MDWSQREGIWRVVAGKMYARLVPFYVNWQETAAFGQQDLVNGKRP